MMVELSDASDAIAALAPGGTLHLAMFGPTRPELFAVLQDAADRHVRTLLTTDLVGFGDDLAIRPFSPYDIRFRVQVPTFDEEALAKEGRSLQDLENGLRNLRAFGYVVQLELVVSRDTVDALPSTILYAMNEHGALQQWLQLASSPPTLMQLGSALTALDAQAPRPRPRLNAALHALQLPVGDLDSVDVRAHGAAGDPWCPLEAHPDEAPPDPDTLARRRRWLLTPERERVGRRGDTRDHHAHAASSVLLRPGTGVFGLILPHMERHHALLQTSDLGLYFSGRFEDDVDQQRFAALCRFTRDEVERQEIPIDLALLRRAVQSIRRNMKPKHTQSAIRWRDEGE
ncbi:MAG: hypothetical protein ACON5B_13940 [Myxococcota bacterium]